MNAKYIISDILASAKVTIDGENDYDIKVHNEEFYDRLLREGSLGLGETYMEKWWDCNSLDDFFYRLIDARLDRKIKRNLKQLLQIILFRIFNFQKGNSTYKVAHHHYNLDNELFKAMLDPLMMYSCAYWKEADNLEQAQRNKLELICNKLQLKKGMRLLDIGCGFGGMAKYAALNHQVEVVGVTISQSQKDYAEKACQGLPIQILLQDYREISGQFDRVVSIGMFEHVGHKNYKTFMEVANARLKEDGLFLLHTIGNNITEYTTDPWIEKYIFPNGMLPSIQQIGNAIENCFIMEDWHNLSVNYDKTLLAWYANFNRHWESLSKYYDDRFYRMWCYYLLSSAGAFRARWIQVWQIVFSKNGVKEGYNSIR